MEYKAREYRRWLESDLFTFEVSLAQSDLQVSIGAQPAAPDPSDEVGAQHAVPLPGKPRAVAERALRLAREDLESYLARDPGFERSLVPRDPQAEAPRIVMAMAEAAEACGVGPMAAVAGAVAEYVGRALLAVSPQVIVENGGDIFLHTSRPRLAAIYAGASPLSGRLAIRINRLNQPLGLCTSSGTVGPSLSFGKADAAIILARSAALADAAASALGNRLRTAQDIEPALEFVQRIQGLYGAAAVVGEAFGAWGEMELERVWTG